MPIQETLADNVRFRRTPVPWEHNALSLNVLVTQSPYAASGILDVGDHLTRNVDPTASQPEFRMCGVKYCHKEI
jgi:hypothetical protein